MNRRKRHSALAGINITPLVDVLLILLVIVMLAMPVFVKRAPVTLPETSLAGAPVPVSVLRAYIGKNGALFVDQAPIDRASLLARVSAGVSIELGADKEATYEQLAVLMAEIQARGPRELSLLTH